MAITFGAPTTAFPGTVKVYALAFDYTMDDLWYGHAFEADQFQLGVGDVVLGCIIQINDAFDGTTPMADVGATLLGETGWFTYTDGPVDASLGDQYALGFYSQNPSATVSSDLLGNQIEAGLTYRKWPAMNEASGWPFSVMVNTTGGPAISGYVTADSPASYPLTVAAGVNDEFVLTLLPSGVPMTFTVAPGTYPNISQLVNAINASLNGSSQQFTRFAGATSPSATLGEATPGGNLSSHYPITITTGVNDTFYWTPNGGSPMLFTIAAQTITNIGEAETAIFDSLNNSSVSWASATGLETNNTGGGLWIQTQAYGADHNGDTLTTGPTDALASLLLTSPVTISGGTNGPLRFVQSGFAAPLLNGGTVTFGTHDLAADLGFTGNPDTIANGSGGLPAGSTVGSGVVFLHVVTPQAVT